jgi:hypothetical protein
MIKTTALIIESSDYTKDGNLKGDVFRAICAAEVVIDGDSVVKNSPKPEAPTPRASATSSPILINSSSDDT